MRNLADFLNKVIDSVPDHIVAVDAEGVIVFANDAWKRFACVNGSACSAEWAGANYLAVCRKAADAGDQFAVKAIEGIDAVMAGGSPFFLEYPCHGPEEKRWFMMSVNAFRHEDAAFFVIAHKDITQRKLAEEKALVLARQDGLTGLANRRHFDHFLRQEWKRCLRLRQPITLAMIDIDFFKLLNDTHGHQYGDDCLVKIGQILQEHARRPGDLCARYGGEEFAMVFGNSTTEQVLPLLQRIQEEIRALAIPHTASASHGIVTVSMGAATAMPGNDTDEHGLIESADILLYAAKHAGRNRIKTDAA